MHHEMDVEPGANEIRAELYRLLKSECISKSPSQAALLEVIVSSHLMGTIADEKSIGQKAFPGFVVGSSTDVRINAYNLRLSMTEYYSEEGRYNSVSIRILKGRNYRVKAVYNPRSAALTSYTSVLEVMSDVGSFPWQIINALGHCVKAMEADANFAPAYALYAEFALCYADDTEGRAFDVWRCAVSRKE